MEFRTILPENISTDKVIINCPHCNNVTTTYQYKSPETINMTALACRGCGTVLENLEVLSKKSGKRILYHKT